MRRSCIFSRPHARRLEILESMQLGFYLIVVGAISMCLLVEIRNRILRFRRRHAPTKRHAATSGAVRRGLAPLRPLQLVKPLRRRRKKAPQPIPSSDSDTPCVVEDASLTLCVICMNSIRAALLLPCHHMVTCVECTEALLFIDRKCPICRTAFEEYSRVFLS